MVETITLASWEQDQRAKSIAKNGSAAPVKFTPLTPPPGSCYTHAGHAAGYGRPRRLAIRGAVYHVTDGNSSITDALRYDARRPEQVSCTAFVGRDGGIGLDVPEDCRPWTTGRWNDETLSLEIIGHDEWTHAQWYARPRQLEAIVRVTVDWGRRYGIPPVWLDADEWAAGAGREGVQPFKAGVNRGWTDHYTAGRAAVALGANPAKWTHVCVGSALREIIIRELLPEAERIMAGDAPAPAPTPQPPALLPEANEMEPFIWRDTRYKNQWLIEAANAIAIDPETRDRAERAGVKSYASRHDQMLRSCMAKSGLTGADLIPV